MGTLLSLPTAFQMSKKEFSCYQNMRQHVRRKLGMTLMTDYASQKLMLKSFDIKSACGMWPDLFCNCHIERATLTQGPTAAHLCKVGSGSSRFHRSPSSVIRNSSMPYSTVPIKPALLSSSSNIPRISHEVVVLPVLPAYVAVSDQQPYVACCLFAFHPGESKSTA